MLTPLAPSMEVTRPCADATAAKPTRATIDSEGYILTRYLVLARAEKEKTGQLRI